MNLNNLTDGGLLALKTALDGYQRFEPDGNVNTYFRRIVHALAEPGKNFDVWELRELVNQEESRRTNRRNAPVIMRDPAIFDRIRLLSEHEMRVLRLISEGHRTEKIAYLMNIAYRTVVNHKAHISSKLGLGSTRDLLKYALDNLESLRKP